MTQDLYTLQQKIIDWARDRGILEYGSSLGQIKLLSTEVVELYDAIVTCDIEEEKSELGDILVVCTIIAHMRDFTLSDAYNKAWEKIKDRKGKLDKDGVFRKE
ncbi:NTP pyrophosphohydrolase MazG, putative catalytic core [uncultured Caudovirales phage]|uniref:NTP pyrophosphohydrolase MazG, putative catalytic core n=1 Tax=uncultured Caudovirales phage TaxID=2100421 RepID=A0A6J5M2J8_9CAUD|nr:NTP pyrophosphohydrolase MazG, putative catalytic core [uncultured Caudovirales phage]